jgi:hypothetical protein
MIPLRLERLERRDTPAGSVTATLRGGTFFVVGDAGDNFIRVNPGPNAGDYVLSGVDTVVKGNATPGGVRSFVFQMRGGDDTVYVNEDNVRRELPGSFVFRGGHGENFLSVLDLVVGKDVDITNGNASDIDLFTPDHGVYLTRMDVGGRVTIRNGAGNSDTMIDGDDALRTVGKGITVRYGRGYDTTVVRATNVGGLLSVNTGAPLDFGRDNGGLGGGFTFVGGAVADRAAIGGVSLSIPRGYYGFSVNDVDVGGDLSLVSGPGAVLRGEVYLTGVTVIGKTSVRTGAAADLVFIDDALFGEFFLSTGQGADTIEVERNVEREGTTLFLGETKLVLGNGNDTLLAGAADDPTRRLQVFAPTTFAGGSGSDTRTFDNIYAPFIEPLVLGF